VALLPQGARLIAAEQEGLPCAPCPPARFQRQCCPASRDLSQFLSVGRPRPVVPTARFPAFNWNVWNRQRPLALAGSKGWGLAPARAWRAGLGGC